VLVKENELQAFPNPFTGTVNITFTLTETAVITLEIYNFLGERISLLEDKIEKQAGSHLFTWSGKGMPSGIYYCKLTGNTAKGKELRSDVKIVLAK